MPELTNPYPGWTPPWVGVKGECMRQAVACVIGEHPIRLPYIDPYDDTIDFWLEWQKVCVRHNFLLGFADRETAEDSGHLWIATVPSLQLPKPATHAIVMRRNKLHFDSAQHRPRKRAPTKLCANPLVAVPC